MKPPSIDRRQALLASVGVCSMLGGAAARAAPAASMQAWPLNTPQRTGIHDIAPAPDGGVWFSAQRSGHLGVWAAEGQVCVDVIDV
ncbi:MAG TPA: hypothetical protein VIY30_02575 [Burkholderiaceae bacterium]